MNDDKFFLAALGMINGLGNKSIALLVKSFGSAKSAWFAGFDDLKKAGVRNNMLESLIAFRTYNPDAPETLAEYCERQKIGVCSIFNADYPPLLKEIDSPPMFFYYRGQLQPSATRVAVVGSRDNTIHGQRVALELGEQFAAAGVTVVSGAARGIDTFAHHGALKAGRTVAVLGCGLGCKHPRERAKFIDQVAENGVVISEFNLNVTPMAGTLVTRNRIIAGLARAIVVVEAGIKSGALIAAKHAVDYGRAVFAATGSIPAYVCAGCYDLIYNHGAKPFKSAQDVLDEVAHD